MHFRLGQFSDSRPWPVATFFGVLEKRGAVWFTGRNSPAPSDIWSVSFTGMRSTKPYLLVSSINQGTSGEPDLLECLNLRNFPCLKLTTHANGIVMLLKWAMLWEHFSFRKVLPNTNPRCHFMVPPLVSKAWAHKEMVGDLDYNKLSTINKSLLIRCISDRWTSRFTICSMTSLKCRW